MGRNRDQRLLKAKEKRIAQSERRQTKVASLEESNEALKTQILDLQQQVALLTEQLQASQAAAQKQAEESSLVIGSLRDKVHALQADKAKHIKAAQARRSNAAAKRAAARNEKVATKSLDHPVTQAVDLDLRTSLLAKEVAFSVLEESFDDPLASSSKDSSLIHMFNSMRVSDDAKPTASVTAEKPKPKANPRRRYNRNRK